MRKRKITEDVWQYGKYTIVRDNFTESGLRKFKTKFSIYNKNKRITSRKNLTEAKKYIDEL
tara:strand:+ start:2884 stop:3066 length:183 start_codon:yes stop_codon:yes gene_type:complete